MALLDNRDQLVLPVLQESPARSAPPALQEKWDHRVQQAKPDHPALPDRKESKGLPAKWGLPALLARLVRRVMSGRKVSRVRQVLPGRRATWDLLANWGRRGLKVNRECPESLGRQDQLVPRDHKVSRAPRVWPEVLVLQARRVLKACLALSDRPALQVPRVNLGLPDRGFSSHIAASLIPTRRRVVNRANSW